MSHNRLLECGDFIYYETIIRDKGWGDNKEERDHSKPFIVGTLETFEHGFTNLLEHAIEMLNELNEKPRGLRCFVMGMMQDFDFLVGRKPDEVIECTGEEESSDAKVSS